MKKRLTLLCLILNTVLAFGNNPTLEKTKQKYFQASSISYLSTAYYPNPETEQISKFKVFYTIYNPKDTDFEFYSKADNIEEFYKNGTYAAVNHREKTIFRYENQQNQANELKASRLAQYGPIALLKHPWKYEDEVVVNGKKQSHYSFIQDVHEYEGRTVKAVYHIYVSTDFLISQFERKSYVNDKLGQTVTYKFSRYALSNKKANFKKSMPQDFALKYYERIETVKPLETKTKAPYFEAVDMNDKKTSLNDPTKEQTLLLFSSVNCGYSRMVSEYINDPKFALNDNLRLINFFGSDSKEHIAAFFKNKASKFPVIANRKDIEDQYGVNGYPILYVIDENGVITELFDGSDQILPFLRKSKKD